MFLQLPTNIRSGLLRLYIAVSLPWVVWFGYQAVFYANRASYSTSARQHQWEAVLFLLLVPVGAPVLLKIALWIRQGFGSPKVEVSGNANHPSSSIQNDINQLRMKVAEDLSCRPDFIVNKYLRTGWLFGKHLSRWPRLDEAKLSAEQKGRLPPSYYERGGMDPSELGRVCGYPTGDGMIDHLMKLQEDIRTNGGLENLIDELVDEHIIGRLKTKARRAAPGEVRDVLAP